MSARLIVRHREGPVAKHRLPDGVHGVGRAAGNAVCIDHPSISREHARLTIEGGERHVEDLGSKNGTFVSEERVTSPWPVADGDLLRFGDVFCSLEAPGAGDRLGLDRTLDGTREWRRQLQPGLGSRSLIGESLRAILELSGFQRGFALLRGGGERWQVIAASGLEASQLQRPEFSGSLGSVRRCVETGRSLVVHHLDPASWLAGRPSVIEAGIEALLCLPLRVNDRLIGVLYADRTDPGEPIDGLELELLESLASHASMALAVARMEEQLTALSGRVEPETLWGAGAFGSQGGSFVLD